MHYLDSLQFPVAIYEEKADRVVGTVTRKQLLRMIRNGTVAATGSWKRIRKLRRVPKPLRPVNLKAAKRRLPVAEDSYTWESVSTPSGGWYFQPHPQHCAAFSPESREKWK